MMLQRHVFRAKDLLFYYYAQKIAYRHILELNRIAEISLSEQMQNKKMSHYVILPFFLVYFKIMEIKCLLECHTVHHKPSR